MSLYTRKFNNDDLIAILALSKDATAIYTTEELVIEMANDAMICFWGKDRSVIGQTFRMLSLNWSANLFLTCWKMFGAPALLTKQKIPPHSYD
jgi:hypothetical protein